MTKKKNSLFSLPFWLCRQKKKNVQQFYFASNQLEPLHTNVMPFAMAAQSPIRIEFDIYRKP